MVNIGIGSICWNDNGKFCIHERTCHILKKIFEIEGNFHIKISSCDEARFVENGVLTMNYQEKFLWITPEVRGLVSDVINYLTKIQCKTSTMNYNLDDLIKQLNKIKEKIKV